jgi:hypothetical protein
VRRKRRDLSRLQLLGAWTGLWTPPRDVEVPPVPKRRLAIGAALAAAVLAAAALIGVAAIDSGKDEGAERERREGAAARAAERKRLEAEQAAHRGSAAPGEPVIEGLERAIAADARARVRAGRLDGPILRVDCERARRGERTYDCLAVTRDIPAGERNVAGAVGHPFVAVVDPGTRRFTWCKSNPVPGERALPDPREVVELPRECRS